MAKTTTGWKMISTGKLEQVSVPIPKPREGWVVVEVAGCGVCHTDIGYLYDSVPTKHPLPLILGHEISGVVVATGAGTQQWEGRRVIVPAVTPCGTCAFCAAGQVTTCRSSLMPGNDHDGGFATHVEVPARGLCPVDAPGEKATDALIGTQKLELWEVSVLADAISTPLQAMRRCNLKSGEIAIIIGAGGVGGFGVQLARAIGAQVVALDIDEKKLDRARGLGAALGLDARTPPKELKKAIGALAKSTGARADAWRVFEMSGSRPGQELAFSLLTQGGSISVVGYTSEPATVRLSNLMAYDATAWGNWGCDPALYPEALDFVKSGQVQVRGLVRKESLARTPEVLEAVHQHAFAERVVLVP
ncbi:MAG: 6-hydroxycyclohex-ene-carbonyl-CoA dehydrogenase [Myxococcaceae bacterium]|nr:6-hydroxycyclohex-ene-carbonyl-CoA dehydrogenase [Myxococcaceae bacterium]